MSMNKGIEFTKHALERMSERGASRKFVEDIVSGTVKAISFPSPKDSSVRLITAKDSQGKHWTVIYSSKVITVHRAHKPEEKRYEKVFSAEKNS